MLLTLDDTRALIGPHANTLLVAPNVEAIATWQRFVTTSPEAASAINATARANMIHCWITQNAASAAEPVDGVREAKGLGFFALGFGVKALVRFKLISGGTTSNVSTGQQALLRRQAYDDAMMHALDADGFPEPPTFLTCGYRLTPDSQLRSVEVRCEYGKDVLWRWPIFGAESDDGQVVEPLTLPNMPGPIPARIRSARKADREGDQEAQ